MRVKGVLIGLLPEKIRRIAKNGARRMKNVRNAQSYLPVQWDIQKSKPLVAKEEITMHVNVANMAEEPIRTEHLARNGVKIKKNVRNVQKFRLAVLALNQ